MKNTQAKHAFKIWEKMAELGSIMWEYYYSEFLELCIELEQSDQKPLGQTETDESPFQQKEKNMNCLNTELVDEQKMDKSTT